jgi:hypothetical protein
MSVYFIVVFFNILIGAVIPFKQYKNGLFLFFLFSGIADPINLILNSFLGINPNIIIYIYNVVAFIVTVSYVKKEKVSKVYLAAMVIFICLIPLLSFDVLFVAQTQNGSSIFIGLYAFVNLLVLYNFLILMSRGIFSTGKINLYFIVIVLSSLLTVLKVGVLAIKLQVGIEYFVISYFLEGIIGIYFIFFDIKNSPQIPLAGKRINTGTIES